MTSNHSWDVAKACTAGPMANFLIAKLLPVDQNGSLQPSEEISSGSFDGVLMLGAAYERSDVCIEVRAENKLDMEKEDNSGRKITSIIEKDSQKHLETTYSRHLIDELVEDHDDLKISHDCGNFVCNETYFRTLSAEIKNRRDGVEKIPILFVHLPPIERISFDRQVILVRTLLKSMVFTPKLDVVGALIKDEFGRVLACRRPPKDQWSGYWEFPGGKIAEGESVHSAVEREIQEELCISVSALDEVSRISHRYEDRIVDLRIIDCGVVDPNSIILTEHDMLRWLEKDELDDVNWLPADLPIIKEWMKGGIP